MDHTPETPSSGSTASSLPIDLKPPGFLNWFTGRVPRMDDEADSPKARPDHGALIRYSLLFGGMILVSLFTIPIAGFLDSDLGTSVPLVSQTATPLTSILLVVAFLLACQLVATLLAHHINPAVALFVLGFGCSILSLSLGGIQQMAWAEASPWSLGLETIVWSLVVLYLVWCLMRATGGLPDVPHDWRAEVIGSFASLSSRPSLLALSSAVLALPIAWFLLVTVSPAQALGAVIVASFVVGMLSRAAAPRLDPILVYGGVVLAGGFAQVVIATGWSGSLADALVDDSMPRLLMVMPITWVGGSLVGISMGIGWARSFVEQSPGVETEAARP